MCRIYWLVLDNLYLKALSMTNMAPSMDTGNPATSDSHVSTDPATGYSTLQYSMILDHLIGDRRPVKDLNPAVVGGLPMPSKSDEQKMIERGMESCAFKSVLACVGGECLSRFWFQWKVTAINAEKSVVGIAGASFAKTCISIALLGSLVINEWHKTPNQFHSLSL